MATTRPILRILVLSLCTLGVSACNQTLPSSDSNEKPVAVEKPAATVEPRPTKSPSVPQPVEQAAAPELDTTAQPVRVQPNREMKLVRQKSATAGAMLRRSFADMRAPSAPTNRDKFAPIEDNGVKSVVDSPVSTFSIDVDTGAYAVVRRFLNQGQMPPTDAVRIEELINYFDYDYPASDDSEQPFSVITEVSHTPWNPQSHLVHIGIKGKTTGRKQRPATNLVFLIDVSGSMNSKDKLPLLKSAFRLLVNQLDARDRVSMVVYAGASGVVLEPTAGSEKGTIMAALQQLSAGGSTHGSAGIKLAYAMAEQARIKNGINRVILATDGDFNVGTVNHEQLIDLIEQERAKGISLTTIGFGQGNYNDHLMEQLADKGNGNYAYIDTINEARKVLVEELSSTLETIAKDVKIQIEWNPAVVSEYRLIGYENRVLAREDFNNDKVDAGDIGAGHTVTALYEITLVGDKGQIDPLRYGSNRESDEGKRGEIAFLKLRYKEPEGSKSTLISQPINTRHIIDNIRNTSDNFRFSAAVAGFGQLLRGGRYTGGFNYDAAADLARGARGEDHFGYRGELLRLVSLAGSLDTRQ